MQHIYSSKKMRLKKNITLLIPLLFFLQCENWGKFWLAPNNLSLNPDWGGAGDTIAINGSGFGNNPADVTVTFNGVAAEIQSVSSSEIKAIVPANTVSGKVRVVGINGNQAVSEKDFRFNKYFLYVTTSTALYGYQFNQLNGSLTTLPGMPLATTNATGDILVAFEYKYLFTTNFSANTAGRFSIDSQTGTVTSLGTAATATNPSYLASDSRNRYLYVSTNAAASINGFSISEANGALAALPGSPYTAASQTLGIAVAPGDAYLFVAQETGNSVRSYSINADGSLTIGTTQAAGTATRGLAIHPSLPYFYVTNTGSSNVHGYEYNRSTGAFSLLAGFPVALGTYSPLIAFDKTGKRMYIASQNPSIGMYGFNLNTSTGAISAVAGSPFAASNFESRGLNIDPYNRYIASAKSTASSITMFSLNDDGTITEVPGQIQTVGATPQRLVFVAAKQ